MTIRDKSYNAYIYIYMCVCMYVCIYVRMYLCTYVCMYVCIFPIAIRKVQHQVEGEQVARSNEAKKSATCNSTPEKV